MDKKEEKKKKKTLSVEPCFVSYTIANNDKKLQCLCPPYSSTSYNNPNLRFPIFQFQTHTPNPHPNRDPYTKQHTTNPQQHTNNQNPHTKKMQQHTQTPRSSRSPRTRVQLLQRTEDRYTSFSELGLASPSREEFEQEENRAEGSGSASRASEEKGEKEEGDSGRRTEGQGEGKGELKGDGNGKGNGNGGTRPRSASARWVEWLVGPRVMSSAP